MAKQSGRGGYTIGYAKPPVSARFKPGQSGNKSGRPRRNPTLASEVSAELKRKITVTVNGKRVKITMQSAMIKKMMQNALNGDIKSINYLLSLHQPVEENAQQKLELPPLENLTDQELTDLYLDAVKKAW